VFGDSGAVDVDADYLVPPPLVTSSSCFPSLVSFLLASSWDPFPTVALLSWTTLFLRRLVVSPIAWRVVVRDKPCACDGSFLVFVVPFLPWPYVWPQTFLYLLLL